MRKEKAPQSGVLSCTEKQCRKAGSLSEGTIYYDVLFQARVPGKGTMESSERYIPSGSVWIRRRNTGTASGGIH